MSMLPIISDAGLFLLLQWLQAFKVALISLELVKVHPSNL